MKWLNRFRKPRMFKVTKTWYSPNDECWMRSTWYEDKNGKGQHGYAEERLNDDE